MMSSIFFNFLYFTVHKKDGEDVVDQWKQDTLMRSADFQRMMARISEVEKCLAKISELKEVYHRMDGYSTHQEK